MSDPREVYLKQLFELFECVFPLWQQQLDTNGEMGENNTIWQLNAHWEEYERLKREIAASKVDEIPFFEEPVGWRARNLHKLKCWPEYFQPLACGSKPFELRLNDRNFKVGDVLFIEEWDPELGGDDPDEGFTDNAVWARVSSMVRAGEDVVTRGLQPGFIIMGLNIRDEPPENLDDLKREGVL